MIDFIDITDKKVEQKHIIEDFLDNLTIEKQFIRLKIERVIKSELVAAAMDKNKMIGIAGIHRKYGLARPYIIVRHDYHGMKIGQNLMQSLMDIASHKMNIIICLIEIRNKSSLTMFDAIGFKRIGKKGSLYYLDYSFNPTGKLIHTLVKAVFPLLKAVNHLRRKTRRN